MMKVRILASHNSTYPNPIEFDESELIAVGREDDEFPGWIWTKTKDGNEGWAPLAYMQRIDHGRAVANTSYSARELDVNAADEVEVLKELQGWAWCVNSAGEHGWLPVKVLSKTP